MHTPLGDSQILWRLCWPIAALNLVLLGIPLSFSNPRAGRSLNLLIAVLVFILYLNGISVMQTWVKTRRISWYSGLVLINGFVFALTCVLFVRRVWMQRWLPQAITDLPYKLLTRKKAK